MTTATATPTPTVVVKAKTNRNMLTFQQKFSAAKWMNKHLTWCYSKHLTGVDMAKKAACELGFPITVANLRGLWTRDMEKVWPFSHDRSTSGVSNSSLRAQVQLIAKAMCDLYGRLGSLEDLDPDVRHLAEHAATTTEGGA